MELRILKLQKVKPDKTAKNLQEISRWSREMTEVSYQFVQSYLSKRLIIFTADMSPLSEK